MIERGRCGDVGVRGKYGQTDPVVRAVLDERLEGVLGHRDPVDTLSLQFKIFAQHGTRQV